MTHPNPVSEDQLNALLDNELDAEERARVLASIDSNPALQARYNELQHLKHLVTTAYQVVPEPRPNNDIRNKPVNYTVVGFASTALMLLGILIGWSIHPQMHESSELNFQYVEKLDSSTLSGDKILLHINTNEPNRVQASLHWAENILEHSRTNHTHLDLEIVVNAEGLNILRVESPYAQEIAHLTKEFDNIKFLACGMAKQNAMLRENKPIKLLPEARDIPAALEQIVTRMQQGWIYLRG
jgi:intracellular sulfur oxidation DsrE/DsrF family protein